MEVYETDSNSDAHRFSIWSMEGADVISLIVYIYQMCSIYLIYFGGDVHRILGMFGIR